MSAARVGSWVVLLALAGCPQGPPPTPPLAAAPAPRTVTPSPAIAELVVAIGAEPHLVGVSPFCTHPPRLEALPGIGGLQPNLEQLEVLQPDLLLWQGTSDLAAGYAERRGAAFESFVIESLADVQAALARLGALFGREEAAAVEAARIQAAVEAARAGASGDRPRVLLVFDREPGTLQRLQVVGGGTFLSECLEACGGVNALEERAGWPTLGPEGLLELDPDVVIELVNRDDVDPQEAAARVAEWSRFSDLGAVEAGRVRAVTGSELLIPGPRLTQTLEKLSEALAP